MDKLYVASFCGSCGMVKKYITENNIEVEMMDLDDDEIKSEALRIGIRNIPCLITESGDRYIGSKIIDYLK